MANNTSNKPVHPKLVKERKGASFNVRELTYLLNGGKEKTEQRERISKLVDSNPLFAQRKDLMFQSREEGMSKAWEIMKTAYQLGVEEKMSEEELDLVEYYLNLENGFSSTHHSMFLPTLASQTSEEQRKYWYPLARNYRIIGTYAQTEILHGGNVRGLETTATYDAKTKEFILHTPHFGAIKWWPGGLGKLSNHCIAMCRLILNGKDYGIHGFIVPIRNLETNAPFPGVEIGDIGPKMGFNYVDNGFLKFNEYRIPRTNMLMRFAQVDENGNYIKPPHAKINYVSMLIVRVGIVLNSSDFLARACTIAIRYSAVRTQFPPRGQQSASEIPILDYQVQQYRLFSRLAGAYAFHFVGHYILDIYHRLQNQIQNQDFSLMAEIHAVSSGLKAILTWYASDGIEDLRKACGGHGYSQFSGLPNMFADFVPACTYEGDNVLLLLQTAGYLLKNVQKVVNGKPVQGSAQYLQLSQPFSFKKGEEFHDLQSQRAALYWSAHQVLFLASEKLQKQLAEKNEHDAFNFSMRQLVHMASFHCYVVVIDNFFNAVSKITNPAIRNVLKNLSDLFFLSFIDNEKGTFLQHGVLTSETASLLPDRIAHLLSVIRPDAVPLVDSWNFPDSLLYFSSLGKYDGNYAEDMWERTQGKGLNAPNALKTAFEKQIKPLLQGKVASSKL